MKTVVFKKEWNDGGRVYRKGALMNVPDEEADRLVREGVADERKQHGPTETKEDAPEPDDADSEGGEP